MVRLPEPLSIWDREFPSPPEFCVVTGRMDATSNATGCALEDCAFPDETATRMLVSTMSDAASHANFAKHFVKSEILPNGCLQRRTGERSVTIATCLPLELCSELFIEVIDDDRPCGAGLATIAFHPDKGAGIVSAGTIIDANRGEFAIGRPVVDSVWIGSDEDEGEVSGIRADRLSEALYELAELPRRRLKPGCANRCRLCETKDLFETGFIAVILVAIFRASPSDNLHLGGRGTGRQGDQQQVEQSRATNNQFHGMTSTRPMQHTQFLHLQT
jgi:hypothetical protein